MYFFNLLESIIPKSDRKVNKLWDFMTTLPLQDLCELALRHQSKEVSKQLLRIASTADGTTQTLKP